MQAGTCSIHVPVCFIFADNPMPLFVSLRPFFIIFILTCFSMGRKCVAQTYTLKVIPIDTGKEEQYTFRQLSQVWHFLGEKQNKLQEKGFLSAAYDSSSIKDSVVSVWLYQGQEYHWAKVDFSTIDPLLWNLFARYLLCVH